ETGGVTDGDVVASGLGTGKGEVADDGIAASTLVIKEGAETGRSVFVSGHIAEKRILAHARVVAPGRVRIERGSSIGRVCFATGRVQQRLNAGRGVEARDRVRRQRVVADRGVITSGGIVH